MNTKKVQQRQMIARQETFERFAAKKLGIAYEDLKQALDQEKKKNARNHLGRYGQRPDMNKDWELWLASWEASRKQFIDDVPHMELTVSVDVDVPHGILGDGGNRVFGKITEWNSVEFGELLADLESINFKLFVQPRIKE